MECDRANPRPSARRTRIAQVVGEFGGGGAERLAWNLALAIRAHGFDAHCIAIGRRGSYAQLGPNAPPTWAMDAAARPWPLVRAAARLRALIDRERIELLHVHGSRALALCYLATRTMRRPPRLWFTWHTPEYVPARWNAPHTLTRLSMRACERVFSPSRDVCERLRAGVCEPGKVAVFPNGVPHRQPSRAVDAAEPVLLWTGRIVPTKDPQILLRAVAQLNAEGLAVRVVMAGSAPPRARWLAQRLRTLADELGVADRVALPGWLDDAAMNHIYRHAAIGVQSSWTEGLSMMLLEQMMAGLAVVATDVGDTREIVHHNRTGLIVPPRDQKALTDALRTLLIDPQLRTRLGHAARTRVLADHSLEAMAQNVELLLEQDVVPASSA